MTDNLDNLLRDLDLQNSNIFRYENFETGGTVIFPSVPVYAGGSAAQRAAEDAWEARSVAMHAAQTAVVPEPKPLENAYAERKRVVRGD